MNPITKINGIDIVAVEKDGEIYLPVTPICNAIGIDAKAQRDKIQSDEFLCSTGVIIPSVVVHRKNIIDSRGKRHHRAAVTRDSRKRPARAF